MLPCETPKARSLFCSQCKTHSVFYKRVDADAVTQGTQCAIWQCANCGSIQLEINNEIVYPVGSSIEPSAYMPASAAELFLEAQSISKLSPRATCALLRSCLEHMAELAGGKGATLAQKVDSLLLSPSLKRIASLCRLYGNHAVHGGQIDLSASNEESQVIAEALSNFINRLADEIFGTQAIARDLEEKFNSAHS